MILIGVSLVSLSLGSVRIPFSKVFSLMFVPQQQMERIILLNIRLPRIIMAIAVGGSLSIAGVIFQGLFRNPLVEPYTLGVSGGAALTVAIAISLGFHFILPIVGFLGAIATVALVYLIAAWRGTWQITTLLLTGVMISFITSSLIMFILAVARVGELHSIIFWIMGNLNESQWSLIFVVLGISIITMFVSLFYACDLNALALGEEEALHLGINVAMTKKVLFILASIVTGCVVSLSGIIGFVGLVVPHFFRILIGRDHRILLPTAFLGGGIFLVISDTLARTIITPLQLPVGVVTGIVGGITFIFLLSKKKSVWRG